MSLIPVDQAVWHPAADLSETGPAQELWDLLISASWQTMKGGMAGTKTSKLMALKRPHLIPIVDSRVRQLMSPTRRTNTWLAWPAEFAANGPRLRETVADLHRHEPRARHLSALRTLDIVLWMHARRRGISKVDPEIRL